jgi:hypothetical protein
VTLSEPLKTALRRYAPAWENLKLPFEVIVMNVEVPVVKKLFDRPTVSGYVVP